MRKVHKADATQEEVVQDGDYEYGVPKEELKKENFKVDEN